MSRFIHHHSTNKQLLLYNYYISIYLQQIDLNSTSVYINTYVQVCACVRFWKEYSFQKGSCYSDWYFIKFNLARLQMDCLSIICCLFSQMTKMFLYMYVDKGVCLFVCLFVFFLLFAIANNKTWHKTTLLTISAA